MLARIAVMSLFAGLLLADKTPKPMNDADKLATALLQLQVMDAELQIHGYRASEELSNARLVGLERARLKAVEQYSGHVEALRKKYGWAAGCAPTLKGEVECR
jgi:hypothetical protein